MFTPINRRTPGAAAAASSGSALAMSSHYFAFSQHTRSPLQETTDDAASEVALLPTSALPDRLRSLFSFQYFNAMQSRSFDTLFASDKSVVLSAPTGSGKTVCFELAIARLLTSPTVNKGQHKIIYIGPTKSLCQERVQDWDKKFAAIDMRCGELTGDTDSPDTYILRDNDIVVTTPEKWDAVTRRRKDLAKFVEMIQLLLIDEVHLINDRRGPTLEVIIVRMKNICPQVRIVAVSATIPNIDELARWIGQSWSNGVPAAALSFGEEFRPVQLDRYCYGYTQGERENDFQFDAKLNQSLMDIIKEHSPSKPTLIFCSTKNGAQQTAHFLAKQFEFRQQTKGPMPLKDPHNPPSVGPFSHPMLKEVTTRRIGFHHAGLDSKDRAQVERDFISGGILVLCCTSTLAVGVNLPAHAVIIKNTRFYINGSMAELEDSTIFQMIGRAGRPQFDDSGVAVILTRSDKRQKYEQIVAGLQPLESKLHLHLDEHINSEIGLGMIHDLSTAIDWLRSTFFHIRLHSNPAHYRDCGATDDLDSWLKQICIQAVSALNAQGLTEEHERKLHLTFHGEMAAKYFLRLATVSIIQQAKEATTLKDMIECLCKAEEFKGLRLRMGEQNFYRLVVNESFVVRYPFKPQSKASGTLMTWQKVSLLLQAELGGAEFSEHEQQGKHGHHFFLMAQDKSLLFQHAFRIAKCMRECFIHEKNGNGVIAATTLEKCLYARSWPDGPTVLRQLKGIGLSAVRKLSMKGIKSFEQLRHCEPENLELWLRRSTPFGRDVLSALEMVPKYELKISKESQTFVHIQAEVKMTCVVELSLLNARLPDKGKRYVSYTTFLATVDGFLSFYQSFPTSTIGGRKIIKFDAVLHNAHPLILCRVGCEDFVGCEVQQSFQPSFDDAVVIAPPVAHPQSVVTRQPSVSELVNRAMWTSELTTALRSLQEIDKEVDRKRTFGSVQDDSRSRCLNQPDRDTKQPALLQRKRKPPTEDAFPDVEIEDIYLDEDELMKLDVIDPPRDISSTRTRCNHSCKDRMKCKHNCCKHGKVAKKSKGSTNFDPTTHVQKWPQRLEASSTTRHQDVSRTRPTSLVQGPSTPTTFSTIVANCGVASEAAFSKSSQSVYTSPRDQVPTAPKVIPEGLYPRREQAYDSQPRHSVIANPGSMALGSKDACDSDDEVPGNLFEALRKDQSSKGGSRRGDAETESKNSTTSNREESQILRFQQPLDNSSASYASFSFSLNDIMECVEIV